MILTIGPSKQSPLLIFALFLVIIVLIWAYALLFALYN